jgi:hypothetical protein
MSLRSDSYRAFLAEFDAYLHARAQLRASEDGSEDQQLCINKCADQWQRVVSARNVIDATPLHPSQEKS